MYAYSLADIYEIGNKFGAYLCRVNSVNIWHESASVLWQQIVEAHCSLIWMVRSVLCSAENFLAAFELKICLPAFQAL